MPPIRTSAVAQAAQALAEAIKQSADELGYPQAYTDVAYAFQVVGDTAVDLAEQGNLAVLSLVYDGVADDATKASESASALARRLNGGQQTGAGRVSVGTNYGQVMGSVNGGMTQTVHRQPWPG